MTWTTTNPYSYTCNATGDDTDALEAVCDQTDWSTGLSEDASITLTCDSGYVTTIFFFVPVVRK